MQVREVKKTDRTDIEGSHSAQSQAEAEKKKKKKRKRSITDVLNTQEGTQTG